MYLDSFKEKFFSFFASRITSLLALNFLIYLLSKSDNALSTFSILVSGFSVFIMFLGMLSSGAANIISEKKTTHEAQLIAASAIKLIGYCSFVSFIPCILMAFYFKGFHDLGVSWITLSIYSIACPLAVFNMGTAIVLEGLGKHKDVAKIKSLSSIVMFILSLTLLLDFSTDLLSITMVVILSTELFTFFGFTSSLKKSKIGWAKSENSVIRSIVIFSLPIALGIMAQKYVFFFLYDQMIKLSTETLSAFSLFLTLTITIVTASQAAAQLHSLYLSRIFKDIPAIENVKIMISGYTIQLVIYVSFLPLCYFLYFLVQSFSYTEPNIIEAIEKHKLTFLYYLITTQAIGFVMAHIRASRMTMMPQVIVNSLFIVVFIPLILILDVISPDSIVLVFSHMQVIAVAILLFYYFINIKTSQDNLKYI